MAYITISKLKHLARHTSQSSDTQPFDLIIHCFHKGDNGFFEAFKNILCDTAFLYEKKEDTYTWLYEGRAPAYHLDKFCPYAHSDYENIEIPRRIVFWPESRGVEKDKNIKLVEKFRDWYNNIFLPKFLEIQLKKFDVESEQDRAFFADKVINGFLRKEFEAINDNKKIFLIKKEIEEEILEQEKKKNTGLLELNKKTLDELREDILNNIYKVNKEFVDFDPRTQELIRLCQRKTWLLKNKENIDFDEHFHKFDKYNYGYSNLEIIDMLEKYDGYKTNFYELLVMYYIKKYNNDIDLRIEFLEKAGFKPCSRCASK